MARILFWGWCLVALAGCVFYWHGGAFAERGIGAGKTTDKDFKKNDMTFYQDVVQGVRAGGNYYDVAKPLLMDYYPERFRSTFNWRLPTYAYLFATLGSESAVRAVLALLVALAVFLNFGAELRATFFLAAAATSLLLIIVLSWIFTEAVWTQELWAATLVSISLGAWGLGRHWLSVLAGCAALALRELVLPYCLVAAILSWWMGRRYESALWLAGIGLFFGYLGWHHTQVQAQLAGMEGAASVNQWLQFGGINFLVLTGRMTNIFLFPAPGGIVFVLLWLALLGLFAMPGDRGLLMLTVTLLYFGAFLVLGEPQNVYWGLFYAPMIPFGWTRGPGALIGLYRQQ